MGGGGALTGGSEVKRRNLAVHCGLVLVLLGLLLSRWLLESTILPGGTIGEGTRRATALGGIRLVAVLFGAYLIVRRPDVTVLHLAAVGFGVCVASVMGSLTVQALYAPPQIVSGWKAHTPAAEWNELGFRGQRIAYAADDYVVVLLGDSHVEAAALPVEAMPERRLEVYLQACVGQIRRVRVISVGAGGYGQDQELLALEAFYHRYRADLVILWQTPTNDIWNNVFNTHMFGRDPKPTFWLDEFGTVRGPVELPGEPLTGSPIVAVALWQRTVGLLWREKGWERRLPTAYVPLARYSGQARTEWQERWNGNVGRMRDEDLDSEKSHYAVMLTPRSPRMQYGLDLTRALIHRIRTLVTARGGKFMMFHHAVEDGLIPTEESVYVLKGKYYRVSRGQFDANLEYVSEGFEKEVIGVRVAEWRVAPEDGHLNAAATNQVMAELGQRAASRLAGRTVSGAPRACGRSSR